MSRVANFNPINRLVNQPHQLNQASHQKIKKKSPNTLTNCIFAPRQEDTGLRKQFRRI